MKSVNFQHKQKREHPAMKTTNTKNSTSKLNHKVVEESIETLKVENERLYMEIYYLENLNNLVQQMKNFQ
ncbi:hypothetical protein BK708_29215 [Bacillus thuringiensis serovar yunnanensis]|nr:hypothetical protein BK708_29215 [Bacillus thuringiensis serovar yunnanensis]